MSTFTLQDLNLPTTADEAIKTMAEMSRTPQQHAELPQPTLGEVLPKSQVNPEALIEDMVAQFSISLKLLLTTVIGGQPNTTPPEGNPPSLQETVSLTLQQADWFKELVYEKVVDMDFNDEIETCVERYCENYFSYNFDPRDHFDIDEAVADRVDDKLEDIVADKIEEVVAEKLSEASVSISF